MSLKQLSTGHWVRTDQVVAIYNSPWEKMYSYSLPQRVMISFGTGYELLIECDTLASAVALRDKLAGEINAG